MVICENVFRQIDCEIVQALRLCKTCFLRFDVALFILLSVASVE